MKKIKSKPIESIKIEKPGWVHDLFIGSIEDLLERVKISNQRKEN
jgi:hypothetical protein